MYVATDSDRATYGLNIRLFQENFLGFLADDSEVLFMETLSLEEVSDTLVDIHAQFQIFSKIIISHFTIALKPGYLFVARQLHILNLYSLSIIAIVFHSCVP